MGAAKSAAPDALAELADAAAALGLELSHEALTHFRVYIETLLFWQPRVSLTTAATALAIVQAHLCDSLPVARFITAGMRVADLGSGAGFPGIVLAIIRPDAHFDLIESRRKRANFLREAVRSAQLTNVEVVEARAEAIGEDRDAPYDAVVSRAVWRGTRFLELSRRLLRPNGLAIAMKGPKALSEPPPQNDAYDDPEVVTYRLPGGATRALFVHRKRDACFT